MQRPLALYDTSSTTSSTQQRRSTCKEVRAVTFVYAGSQEKEVRGGSPAATSPHPIPNNMPEQRAFSCACPGRDMLFLSHFKRCLPVFVAMHFFLSPRFLLTRSHALALSSSLFIHSLCCFPLMAPRIIRTSPPSWPPPTPCPLPRPLPAPPPAVAAAASDCSALGVGTPVAANPSPPPPFDFGVWTAVKAATEAYVSKLALEGLLKPPGGTRPRGERRGREVVGREWAASTSSSPSRCSRLPPVVQEVGWVVEGMDKAGRMDGREKKDLPFPTAARGPVESM